GVSPLLSSVLLPILSSWPRCGRAWESASPRSLRFRVLLLVIACLSRSFADRRALGERCLYGCRFVGARSLADAARKPTRRRGRLVTGRDQRHLRDLEQR